MDGLAHTGLQPSHITLELIQVVDRPGLEPETHSQVIVRSPDGRQPHRKCPCPFQSIGMDKHGRQSGAGGGIFGVGAELFDVLGP